MSCILNLTKSALILNDIDKYIVDEALGCEEDENVKIFNAGIICLTIEKYNADMVIIDKDEEFDILEDKLTEKGYRVKRV